MGKEEKEIQVHELYKGINNSINKIDDNMGYEYFALAVSKVLKEEYGSHLFYAFMEVLSEDLSSTEDTEIE